jgi:hypothetical protein
MRDDSSGSEKHEFVRRVSGSTIRTASKRTGYGKVVAISRCEHHAGESPPLGANQTGGKQRGPGNNGYVNDKREKRCHPMSPFGSVRRHALVVEFNESTRLGAARKS